MKRPVRRHKTFAPRALATVRKFFPNVQEVKDASTGVTITVSPGDTKASDVKSHKTCAAAVACKRQYHLDGVILSRAIAYMVRGTVATRYVVPQELNREIIAFDRGGSFEPGEYHLQKPDKHIALGTPRPSRNPEGPHKKRPVPRHVTGNIRAVLGGGRPSK